jgi:probable rRNA maturation factor
MENPREGGEALLLHLDLALMKVEPNIVHHGRGRLSQKRLKDFVKRASRAARVQGGITVMLASNRKMKELNSQFRGKDQATDVLSFPAHASAEAYAGDIAIAIEIAERNARELKHSTASEVEILVLHGILHLAGYDHDRDNGEMEKKERTLRAKLGLPAGLIERSSGQRRSRRT